MAGKRLLDAAKLVNASTSIAKQHFGVRRQQWDVYTQTSSLAKAVKSQTDRVTVTAAAAIELTKRFNEAGPAWQRQQGQEPYPAQAETPAAKQAMADNEDIGRELRAAAEGAVKVAVPRQEQAVGAQQARQDELASHASHADDGDSRASYERRQLQRQAEKQIPAQAADTQPNRQLSEGQDVFSERPNHVSPELSSLPRMKIPKHAEDVPGPEAEMPECLNTDVFSSRKVASMLGHAGPQLKSPYANRRKMAPQPLPEMVAARKLWEEERAAQNAVAEQPVIERQQTPSGIDAEIQNLAQSISQDAMSTPEPASTDVNIDASETRYEMRESRVPSTRFGRFWQYASLGSGMAMGAVNESFRRMTGGSSEGSLMLSEANLNRLVAKLSRMRGAALKLGQMISFQDSKVLPGTINTVLQRVQDSADYMPASQRDQVLMQNLGHDWRDLFSKFEDKPFAAASIGQVHKATLKSNGKDVAVKVQYPGVRNSIDSDLNNLSLLLTASRLLPKGMFLDRTIANARTELGWECDYEREAKACIRFRELLQDEDLFSVPEVYLEASGPGVLTAEFMHGTAVTKMKTLTQHDRDWVGTQILRLCLRELMEWRFMQTDPNWTNFLYNQKTKKLELLDFGASRDFPAEFVEPYVALLIAAHNNDRDACRDLSIQLGYLTGAETPGMLQAHVDSIMTLAEPFVKSAPDVYDFEDQTITDRVRANIGLMLRERLAPPPEETYSLHRKLSGAFLLCARLRSRVRAKEMFGDAMKVWEGRKGGSP
ncbi:hypothetical protein LTR62_002355 [Meristemomyces frigidus]|uniref:ABC1 atypical kinase-like domain-containing protein n=1 Tax=Meristemomyces frigidus TaxID=1508187 RepID=A0AAN7T8M3_9PEZI|nr:hypothetical protein LTR62_002355 [Meristemomyces frigidus]